MATLTPLNAAFPLDADDGTRLLFTDDTSPQVLSRALDNITDPFLTMDSPLEWTVEYRAQGFTDDDLWLGIRIVNGGTILAAANASGDFQNVATNIGNSENVLVRDFFYTNTTADLATWNGASVELEQIINRNMGADGCHLEVDYVEFNGSYTPSVTVGDVSHTTDIGVGTFADHTTDLVVSEFPGPTDTSAPSGAFGHQTDVDDNGTIWMLGTATGSTQIINLWEGPASGPGFWQLHQFDHGSGTIRDISLAVIGDTVHVVYCHHVSSAMTQRHIEWSTTTESWTDNGAFGTGESHSDPVVSAAARIDMVATSDDELVVVATQYNYVNFGGSTAYRMRRRLYRSSSESFSTSGLLVREEYGPNIFDRPFVPGAELIAAGTDAYFVQGFEWARFSSASELSKAYLALEDGISFPYWPVGDTSTSNIAVDLNGRLYAPQQTTVRLGPEVEDGYNVQNYLSGAYGDDEVLFDEGYQIAYKVLPGGGDGVALFIDHYGEIGALIDRPIFSSTDHTLTVYVTNGLGTWFGYEYEQEFDGITHLATETVDRSLSAWQRQSSGPWTYWGVTIPTWYRAHTTDVVISDDPVVTHSTDLVVRNVPYGDTTIRRVWFSYDSNYYVVTSFGTGLKIWKTPELRSLGNVVTSWHYEDTVGYTDVMIYKSWDVELTSAGVFHFLFVVWLNSRMEVHHSEYDIDTDTWTHNGLFHNSTVQDDEGGGHGRLIERANGDLIALFEVDNALHYSINDGTGFGTAIDLSTSAAWTGLSLATDGGDTHLIAPASSTSIYHWRLTSTDVLSARQGPVSTMLKVFDFPGASKPLVTNGEMYIPTLEAPQFVDTTRLWVTHAATGSDAPTWTHEQVSTRQIERVYGFFRGLNGAPTFVYVEGTTWKIWRAYYDGSSWVEEDTGQNLNPSPRQITYFNDDPELHGANYDPLHYPEMDADGYAWLVWMKEEPQHPIEGLPSDLNWRLLRVNLNPLVVHTTDVVLSPAPLKVTHTTDVIASLTSMVDHTTDLVTITGAGGTVSINHSTDLKSVDRASVAHMTDVISAFTTLLTHTTDLHIVATPHDLSVTITLPFDLTVVLEKGYKPEGTGLGVPRDGDQIPRIYKPTHKVISR